MAKRKSCVLIVLLVSGLCTTAQSNLLKKDTATVAVFRPVMLSCYSSPVSFFCKKEVQLQKLSKLNVFIRLGTKDWVDYLEQKPNVLKRP